MSNASADPNSSTCTEWSMTNSAGCSGLINLASPPSRFMASRMAARSTTAGRAGEILEQHAARREGNFFFRFRILVPRGERANFILRDVAPIFGAQQVLQQNAQREREMPGGDSLLVESV